MSLEVLICDECGKMLAGTATGKDGLPTIGSPCIYCKVGRLKIFEADEAEKTNEIPDIADVLEEAGYEIAFDTSKGDEILIEEESDEDAELPIDTFITAQRSSRKLVRLLKAQYADLKTVRRKCVKCGLACLIAASSATVIEDLEAENKRAEVICFECCKEFGIDPDKGGITEGQAKELSLILMKRSVQKENAN